MGFLEGVLIAVLVWLLGTVACMMVDWVLCRNEKLRYTFNIKDSLILGLFTSWAGIPIMIYFVREENQ